MVLTCFGKLSVALVLVVPLLPMNIEGNEAGVLDPVPVELTTLKLLSV